MWRRSGRHVPRALRQKSGISIFSFGMIPGTLPEPLKIGKTEQRARSYLDRDLGRLLAFEMRWQSSGTQEYPSLIDTFFVAHTVNGVFTRDEDLLIYEEMGRLEATGTYTDDEINRLARRGKQRGHIPGVDRVLPARVTAGPSRPAPESTLKSLHKKVDFMMRLFKSYSEYSDAFSQFESVGASGSGGSGGSGGCGDDEESADDQEGEDEDGDGDSYDMLPENLCHGGTNYLTEKYMGLTLSLGNLLALFEPSDIDGVRALRWGRNDRALSWKNPSNTGNVPPLLAPSFVLGVQEYAANSMCQEEYVDQRRVLSSSREPKFLIKMFPRRSEDEDSEYLFFEGDGSSSDEWRDYGMLGKDYEGPPVFDDDQYDEELMPVYDTTIEDVIEEEEEFGTERQPVVAVVTLGDVEDAPDVDEGAQAVPTPIYAPLPPPPAAVHEYVTEPSTLSKSRAELRKESVYKSVEAEESERTYQAFDGTFYGSYPAVFKRRTKRRTNGSNTFAAPQQPDP
nr:F-box domain, leucine-rich repeat domain, L domain-like protein [Tanacetum cinerariifolium]